MKNYEKLEAGRELDELIAVHVFNAPKPVTVHEQHFDTEWDGESNVWHCTPDFCNDDRCEWQPLNFSTDIDNAMLLIELYDEWYMEYSDGVYFATFGENLDKAIVRDSLPHAMCLAALASKPIAPYLSLPPGRELDALVWLVLEGRPVEELASCRYVDGNVLPHSGKAQAGHISPPPYSTEIGRAFSVLQKLYDADFGVISVSNGDGDSYDCNLMPQGFDSNYKTAHAMGKSWPHAICLAVVKSLGKSRHDDV
jgi:hypothetical protein